jgi:CrcB protein
MNVKLFLFLAIGGTIGTWSRYLLQGVVQPASGSFPWGTLAVNIVGAFALGFLMRFLLGSATAGPEVRAAVTIGFCGAFTTMSTFSFETVALLGDGEYWRAFAYMSGTVIGGVTAIVAGTATATRLL